MLNTSRHLRKGLNQSPELDHNRLAIDQALQSRALSFIQSSPDFAKVQTGEITPSVFIEQVVASSPKEISSAVRVMCAVILGAFVMQGCAGSQVEAQTDSIIPDVIQIDKDKKIEKLIADNHTSDKYREIILATVKRNGGALEYTDESLKKDREIVLTAVTQDGNAFKYADESLRKDKEFVLTAVKTDGSALEYADDSLKKDREIVLAAVTQDGNALAYTDAYTDESFREDREIVLAAVTQDGNAFKYADESLKKDKDVLQAYFKGGLLNGTLDYISDNLKELNIDFPERFDLVTLHKLFENRKNIDSASFKPLAIIIFTKKDWNSSFRQNQVSSLISHGYNVVYFEAEDENEVYKALKSATIDVNKKADLFVLGGHGSQNSIAMGANDPAKNEMENEIYYIDTSDEEEMVDLTDCLSEKSVLILESCSTGEGKEGAENIANTLGRIFPQAKVFAPTNPFGVIEYEYDEDNRVIGVNYRKGKENTYIQKPKKVITSNPN